MTCHLISNLQTAVVVRMLEMRGEESTRRWILCFKIFLDSSHSLRSDHPCVVSFFLVVRDWGVKKTVNFIMKHCLSLCKIRGFSRNIVLIMLNSLARKKGNNNNANVALFISLSNSAKFYFAFKQFQTFRPNVSIMLTLKPGCDIYPWLWYIFQKSQNIRCMSNTINCDFIAWQCAICHIYF